jgi:hypothetical protein
MTKFEIGKSYEMRSACDQNCKWSYTVITRTAQTITLKDDHNKVIKCRVIKGLSEIYKAEAVKPLGSYSMAPTLTA